MAGNGRMLREVLERTDQIREPLHALSDTEGRRTCLKATLATPGTLVRIEPPEDGDWETARRRRKAILEAPQGDTRMTDGKAAEIRRTVRRLRQGTVVTYGDISREVFGHAGAGPAVGQVIRAETDNAERDGRPGTFPWWRVVGKGLRPHEGAGEWLMKEGVTLRPDGSVPGVRTEIDRGHS